MKDKTTAPKPETLAIKGDFQKFTRFMTQLLAVPHSEIKDRLDSEKAERTQRRRKVASGRASHDND